MTTRIPLQTGGSAWISRIFALGFTLAAGFSATLLTMMWSADSLATPQDWMLPLAPAVFAGVAIASHVALWRARASDLLLGEDGLAVHGPVMRGKASYPWGDIDPARCRIERDPSVVVTVNGEVTVRHLLKVGLRRGGDATLAQSVDRDEIASFEALVALLQSRGDAVNPGPQMPPEVLRCPGCGAPVAPDDAPRVACARCQTGVSVPEPLAARVRAGRAVGSGRATASRELAALSVQPPAAVVNRWLLATLIAPYLVPVAGCLAPVSGWTWLPALFTVFQVANLRVVERRAFHGLWIRFGAIAGEKPGDPACCRSCGGPLAPPGDAAATSCPWCEAVNVRGLVLRPRQLAVLTAAGDDLDAFTEIQRARRREPLFWAVAGVLVAVGVAVWGAVGGFA